ncbi:MAG: metal-dependent transcriptional regulator [Candidatus Bathyarchaeota archaeon]|nr:MAG: metal-dependent transcriptional regulator [Candidatus Bathyarchaeota archaeon]
MSVKTDATLELSETEQSYVETIHALIEKRGFAAVIDIADGLSIKSPSVTNMLQKLDLKGFVKYTRYRNVTLTKKGVMLAKLLKKRHRSLKTFLEMLGVNEDTAEKDACNIEHIAHATTIKKLAKFVDFVQKAPQSPKWLEHFKHFERTGKHPKSCADN